jgi:protein pelota
LNRNFTIFKPEWDSISLDRISLACDVARQADVAAVVMQEGARRDSACRLYTLLSHRGRLLMSFFFLFFSFLFFPPCAGLANVCLITDSMTIVRQRVETQIPRKRKGNASQHEKSLEKFYDQVVQAILRHVDFSLIKAVIIASPGFVKVRRVWNAEQPWDLTEV